MEGKQTLMLILVVGLVLVGAYMLSPKSYYSHNHPILNKVRENFSKLHPKYADIPLREGNSAYTENKSVITLCLKDPDTQKYYDFNTIMYVALHELGHMTSKTQGHNDEWQSNFANLLRRAAQLGIYDPRIPIPETYCGIGPND
jgi:hypothetical protein